MLQTNQTAGQSKLPTVTARRTAKSILSNHMLPSTTLVDVTMEPFPCEC